MHAYLYMRTLLQNTALGTKRQLRPWSVRSSTSLVTFGNHVRMPAGRLCPFNTYTLSKPPSPSPGSPPWWLAIVLSSIFPFCSTSPQPRSAREPAMREYHGFSWW